jgi:hypothetical protein
MQFRFYDARFLQTDVRHQSLKASRSAAVAADWPRSLSIEIVINNDDPLRRPAQGYGALAKIILS